MQSQPPDIAGTFTGFLHSLVGAGVSFSVGPGSVAGTIKMTVRRSGKFATVELSQQQIADAKTDFASVELGEIISAVL